MIVSVLAYFVIAMGIVYLVVLCREYFREKEHGIKEKGQIFFYGIAEIFVWFFATFGVSDTAVNSLIFPLKNNVEIRKLPGTIVVGATVPMCFMSYSYLTEVRVSSVTLVALVAAQAFGSFVGASVVSKLNAHIVRIVMGTALVLTAVILFAKNYIFEIAGGTATGLTSGKLVVAIIIVAFMGMLNMIGFGSTTPNMAILLAMGMSPIAVLPIVMCANAFTCLAGCLKFIQAGSINPQITLIETIAGAVGIVLAMNLVSSMDSGFLQILMMIVMTFSAIQMFQTEHKERRVAVAAK